jgi:hypothetical protein
MTKNKHICQRGEKKKELTILEQEAELERILLEGLRAKLANKPPVPPEEYSIGQSLLWLKGYNSGKEK